MRIIFHPNCITHLLIFCSLREGGFAFISESFLSRIHRSFYQNNFDKNKSIGCWIESILKYKLQNEVQEHQIERLETVVISQQSFVV